MYHPISDHSHEHWAIRRKCGQAYRAVACFGYNITCTIGHVMDGQSPMFVSNSTLFTIKRCGAFLDCLPCRCYDWLYVRSQGFTNITVLDILGSKAAALPMPFGECSNALDSISHFSEVPDVLRIQIICFSSSEKQSDLGTDCVSQHEMIVPSDVSWTSQTELFHVTTIFLEGEIATGGMWPKFKSSQMRHPDCESHTPTQYKDLYS